MSKNLPFTRGLRRSEPPGISRTFLWLTVFLSCIFFNRLLAQDQPVKPPSYPKAFYNPLQPPPDNKFGVLYNSQNYQVQVPTQYYGLQSVWLTAYLPFIETEYDPLITPIVFGPHYTTGLALSSPRDPALNLWAPIEITAIEDGDEQTAIEYPFASIFGKGSPQLVHTGSFSLLSNLNEDENPLIQHPILSTYGPTALYIAQRFTKFTHEFLGHDGVEKSGIWPIKITLRKSNSEDLAGEKFYYNTEDADGMSLISKSDLGQLLSAGIIFTVSGTTQFEPEAFSIAGAISQVISLSFVNWENPAAKFTNPSWTPNAETALPQEYPRRVRFDDPKQQECPSTYKGEFWVDGNVNGKNSTVITHLFYLLNSKVTGYPDVATATESFTTEPLLPGDPYATYALALKLYYDVLASGFSKNTTYIKFRELLLNAAVKNGHPVGSPVYKRVMMACYAVGIGAKPFTSNADCAVTKEAETWFNGPIHFNAKEVTLTENPASQKAVSLIDCSVSSRITTSEFNPAFPEGWAPFQNLNPEQDQIYGLDHDLLKSKVGVSVHAYSVLAKDWFKNTFEHLGMEGKGKIGLVNVVGDPSNPTPEIFYSETDAYFFYPYSARSACRDEIFRTYSLGMQLCRDFPILMNVSGDDETRLVLSGVSQIFALEIKKDYERAKQNPDAENIWTLFEEINSFEPTMDFSQPKLHGQPAVYHGANWKEGEIRHNTGFLNFFYFLLVHGTEGAEGYTSGEPGSLTYFVNKMPRELVLRVLWNASRAVSHNPSIDEFRLATLSELHKLDPVKYHPKSKEHIAFYDAWAAVLGLPDYASTLAHYPEDDASIYPWSAKVGVESEYPLYESYRLFEVSKSPTFTESPQTPVHRFVSNQAPDLTSGMTYGEINLEAGERYYVRSHMALGPESRAHCAGTDDPGFCESLLNKKKWTITYPFTTEKVLAAGNPQPAHGSLVPAWETPLSWGSIPGAAGYDIYVTDDLSPASGHIFATDQPYDEDKPTEETTLALSKQKMYTYKIVARQKLGSEWAVHVLPNGMIVNFTQQEKDNFPTIYGEWTQEVSIKTNLPTVAMHSPANHAKVPLFGVDLVLKGYQLSPNSADYYKVYIKDPLYESVAQDTSATLTDFTISVPELPGIEDNKEYKWAIVPHKNPVGPFILEEEEGEVSEWFHFVTDAKLIPKPDIGTFACLSAGEEIQLSWEPVTGAQGYEYCIINQATQMQVKLGIVEGDTKAPKMTDVTSYPGPYLRKVRAGIKDSHGDWVFGPAAEMGYGIIPPSPSNLSPNNVNGVKLGQDHSVQLTWTLPPGVTDVQLFAKVEGGPALVDTEVFGNTLTLTELPFDKDITWDVSSIGPDKSCESKQVSATFHTEAAPEEFDFGFELRVDNNDPKIFGGLYHYSIKVIRPDGQIDFTGTGTVDADTWLQVGFVPEEGQVINGNEMNGQLTDQSGDYEIELKIIDMAQCQNCPDVNAHPVITVKGVEYKRKLSDSAWKLNKFVQPQPANPEFPSRTIGATKVIKLHYNLPN